MIATIVAGWALEILNEGDALAELPPLIHAVQAGEQRVLEDVVANLAASYRGPNYFSEGKYFAVDCEEEVPFTDAARIRADIAAYPAFANFGVVGGDWHVWPTGSSPMRG